MTVEQFKLKNGIRCAFRTSHLSELVSIQCWVGVGSLYERANEQGMSHLLEHMLFKGTQKRGVGEIARTVEAHGGDINAYTSFDRTVYYVTLPSADLEMGIDVLSDALFNSAFDPTELAREKEVVIEEIRRSLDNPSALVGRKIFKHVFAGTEAARPIIGTEESVRNFSREEILDFYRGWYQPENVTVVITGNFAHRDALALCEKYFVYSGSTVARQRTECVRDFPVEIKVEVIKGDYKQPRLEFTYAAPAFFEKDAMYLDLCSYALGQGDASRLHRLLKDKLQIVTAIGASTYTPHFGGIFSVSTVPVEERIDDVIKTLVDELHVFRTNAPITETELARARASTKTEYFYQEETVGGQARSLGFNLTTPFGMHYDSVYLSTINSAQPDEVMSAFRRWCIETNVVIVAQLPQESKVTEADIRKSYLRALETTTSAKPQVHKKTFGGQAAELIEIQPGIQLIYRQVHDAKFFTLAAAQQGGLRAEHRENAGVYSAVGNLLGKANSNLSYEQLLDLTEMTGSSIEGFAGKDSIGMRLHCLSEDAERLMPVFFESLLRPQFPEEQWQANRLEILEDIRCENDLPSTICFREFQKLLYGDHPYHFPMYGYADSVAQFSAGSLLSFYMKQRDRSPWVLSAVSRLPAQEVVAAVKQYTNGWTPSHSAPVLASEGMHFIPERPVHEHIPKEREQTHIVVGVPGLTWKDKHRHSLEVLSTILSGQGGRLFIDLRDRQSLAYTVSAICSYGVHPGMFGAYIACAPDKAEHARHSLQEKMFAVLTDKPSVEEMMRAKTYLIGSHAVDMQRASSQAMNMALMQLFGVGFAEYAVYTEKIKAISQEDVLEVATDLLKDQRVISVSVG